MHRYHNRDTKLKGFWVEAMWSRVSKSTPLNEWMRMTLIIDMITLKVLITISNSNSRKSNNSDSKNSTDNNSIVRIVLAGLDQQALPAFPLQIPFLHLLPSTFQLTPLLVKNLHGKETPTGYVWACIF